MRSLRLKAVSCGSRGSPGSGSFHEGPLTVEPSSLEDVGQDNNFKVLSTVLHRRESRQSDHFSENLATERNSDHNYQSSRPLAIKIKSPTGQQAA